MASSPGAAEGIVLDVSSEVCAVPRLQVHGDGEPRRVAHVNAAALSWC